MAQSKYFFQSCLGVGIKHRETKMSSFSQLKDCIGTKKGLTRALEGQITVDTKTFFLSSVRSQLTLFALPIIASLTYFVLTECSFYRICFCNYLITIGIGRLLLVLVLGLFQ